MPNFDLLLSEFKKEVLPSEEKILQYWEGEKTRPLLSVLCHTYNHEKFIEDTLKGFLLQLTNFPFEIIINDDASTDCTRDIILKYKKAYPHIIKVICHEDNQYSKGIRPLNFTLPAAKGEYVCICEGDDYWIDKNKLSDHVKFLVNNPEYSIHIFDSYEESSTSNIDYRSSKLSRLKIRTGEYSKLELKKKFVLLPLTSCFKNSFDLPFPRYFSKSINGDAILNMKLSNIGKAYVDGSKKVAVYRHHSGGIWSAADRESKYYEHMHTMLVHSKMLSDDGFKEISHDKLMSIVVEIFRHLGLKAFLLTLSLRVLRKIKRMGSRGNL